MSDRTVVADFSHPHRARRSHRHRRPERQRQDDAPQLLTGALAPDSGTLRLGANLEIATLDAAPRQPDPEHDVAEALTGGAATP